MDSDVPSEPVEGVSSQQLRDLMRDSPNWDPHHMLNYQRMQLSQLLHHAKTHTAFYKNRLDSVLKHDGEIDWDGWSEIPIVTRADLRHCAEEMQSTNLPPNHGAIHATTSSGSTGIPITVRFADLSIHVAKAAWNRFFALHGVDWSAGRTEFKTLLPNGKTMTERIIHPTADRPGDAIWINRALEAKDKLQLLGEANSWFLADVPNHTEILAHENLRIKNPVSLKFIVGIGMEISPEQEALFKRSFGATTLMPYSSKEGTLMAYQCAVDRGNYHVCSELLHFEVLNKQNEPCAIGEKGRVVITPFFNAAQPLIRYEQGDEVVRGPPCRCGSKLPVLSEISGRSDPIFRFPGENVALVGLNYKLIQATLQADAFQFAQVAPMKVVVRYISPVEATGANCEIIRAQLNAMIRCEPEIEFQRVNTIPANSGGKQQRVTREFDLV